MKLKIFIFNFQIIIYLFIISAVFFNIPKSAVRTQIPQSVLDMGMSISTPQQNPSKSEMLQRTQLTPIG